MKEAEGLKLDAFDGMKLVLAQGFTECRGWGPNQASVTRLAYFLGRHTGIEFDYIEISGDAYVDRFRNTAAKRFMESQSDWLFFIDTDEAFGILDALKVIGAPEEYPIVGAGYPCKNVWDFFGVVFRDREEDDPDYGRPIVNADGLVDGYIVPTGFMRIHRSVFESLLPTVDVQRCANPADEAHPIELPDYFSRIGPLGEDGSFNVRCERIGIHRWVQPDVTIGHLGTKQWDGNLHQHLMGLPGGSNDTERAG